MAPTTIPRFDFSSSSQNKQRSLPDSKDHCPTSAYTRHTPRLHIRTPTGTSLNRRPPPIQLATSPPDSPTSLRRRSYTMLEMDTNMLADSGAITPPLTPSKPSHSKSESVDSVSSLSVPSTLQPLGRQDSATALAPTSEPSAVVVLETKQFPYWITDYERGKKIGEGQWSDVYLAKSCPPKPAGSELYLKATSKDPGTDTTPTPPITPTRKTITTTTVTTLQNYAIKHPATRSSKPVLKSEAHILTHLSQVPDSTLHTIPFHGLDSRTGALVLDLMSTSLESWIQGPLEQMSESERTTTLVNVFPGLALQLIDALIWLDERAGVTHVDVKPGNVLLDFDSASGTDNPSSGEMQSTTVSKAVFSDFSSAILQHPTTTTTTTTTTPTPTSTPSTKPASKAAPPPAPIGGGTWDYLSPSLLLPSTSTTSPTPATTTPNLQTDIHALSLTLLVLITGLSPYAFIPNIVLRRDVIKQGTPMKYVGYGDQGRRSLKRVADLEKGLGWGVGSWLGSVMGVGVGKGRDGEERVVDVGEWRGVLVGHIERGVGARL